MTTPATSIPPDSLLLRFWQRLEGPLFVPVRSQGKSSCLMLGDVSGGLPVPVNAADIIREVLSVLETSH